MKFSEFKYERPNIDEFKHAFSQALETFNKAESVEVQLKQMDVINQLRFDFNTMSTLAYIRHSVDTNDEFYDQEKTFFDQNSPIMAQLTNAYYQALVTSSFKDELALKKGDLLFKKAALALETFSPEIMAELQEENVLSSEFQKLLASAKIDFEGEIRNLSQMAPFAQSKERSMRKKASKASTAFLESHEKTLDELYDKLVKVRTKIAHKLGYKNFVELAYKRWGRVDYNAHDVAKFRNQVLENIVPLNKELAERKRERLGLDTLYHYDLALDFASGNPTTKGNKDWMVEQAKTMYEAMGPETDEFFNFMLNQNLLDLEAKKGKAGGGYCTFIANYNAPFIFSNFNGTKGDVDVLTHEAGHAFQMYMSRHHEVPEYLQSSQDIMEIHSMSMEFFARAYIEKFFKEDTQKYMFSHLSQALMLIAYASSIDEFQHAVYENPDLTIEERKELWRNIDKKYFPYKVYDDNTYLERGNGWQSIMHVYVVPFYMIDYALAQICAFQYYVRSQEDKQKAWDSYVTLCKAGGSDSFLGLLSLAELDNPFNLGTIQKVIPKIKMELDSFNDKDL